MGPLGAALGLQGLLPMAREAHRWSQQTGLGEPRRSGLCWVEESLVQGTSSLAQGCPVLTAWACVVGARAQRRGPAGAQRRRAQECTFP